MLETRRYSTACGVLVLVASCGGKELLSSPVTDLTLFAPPSVSVGGTLQVAARVIPDAPVAWVSETPGVATISATGTVFGAVTGVAPGLATIRVTAGAKSATVTVAVFAASFNDLIVAPKHVCARAAGGLLYCWGDQASGMLGPIANSQVCGLQPVDCSTTPVPSVSSPTFVQVSAGLFNTCGRTVAGEAYCWGGNSGHLLTSSAEVCSNGELCTRTPVRVQGAPSLAWIGVGDSHFCGLTTVGIPYCWGNNDFGQLGAPVEETCGIIPCSRVPLAVSGGFMFRTMSAGAYHTCGLTAAGQAYCWGWNYFGQLGIGRTSGLQGGEHAPVAVATALTFATISAGHDHTCALTPSGQAYCWGRNSTGHLGDGSTSDALIPRAVTGGIAFESITTGLEHTCALTHAGVAYCWGHNRNQGSTTDGGALGDGTFETRLIPTLLARAIAFVQLGAGRSFTCGRTGAGIIYCWGSNSYGRIGVGSLAGTPFPTPSGVGGAP